VKFVVDAQLPRRAVGWLRAGGCDAVHTADLPDGNRTTDVQIIELAERDGRAVVTKEPTSSTRTRCTAGRQSSC